MTPEHRAQRLISELGIEQTLINESKIARAFKCQDRDTRHAIAEECSQIESEVDFHGIAMNCKGGIT